MATFTTLSISACSCNGCNGGGGGDDSSASSSSSGSYITSIEEKPVFEDTELMLANNGASDYKIVLPQNASACIKNAGKELQNYLKASTGVTLPIIDDSAADINTNGKYISLGRTKLFTECGISVGTTELNRDGFKIKKMNDSVVICGAKDIGTLYGVYGFLEYQINFEAFASDEVYYVKESVLPLKDFDHVEVPSFAGRMTDGPIQFDTYGESLLRLRNFSNGLEMYDYGGERDFLWGHSETYADIIPKSIYNDPKKPETYHPEWFAYAQIQMCLTNEELIQEAIDRCIWKLETTDYGEYMSISQNDGDGWCGCTPCSAEREAYGASGHAIRFVNKVIDGVEEWRMENQLDREILYSMFAYASAQNPPTSVDNEGNITVKDPSCIPHEKMSVRLVDGLGNCLNHAITDESCAMNTPYYNRFQQWRTLTDVEFTIYDYIANYKHFLLFLDTAGRLKENLLVYKNELNINHVYFQNASSCEMVSMNALYNYLLGKLMWNVNLNVNDLIDNFFAHYYKEAAPAMREYFEFMRSFIATEHQRNGYHQDLYNTTSPASVKKWPRRIVEQGQEYLQQALAATELADTAIMRETLQFRVKSEIACSKYVLALNYLEYYDTDKTTYFAFLEEWERECINVGATLLAENGDNRALSDFVDNLRENYNK